MNEAEHVLLSDRILLNKQISDSFKQNVSLRYNEAVKMMNIDDEHIEIIYCSSVNKHTCKATFNNHHYLIFDEHHNELLTAMNLLYYCFGQTNIKKPLYEIILNTSDYFENRLKTCVLNLLSEKALLEGNIKKSYKIIKELKNISLEIEDKNTFDIFAQKINNADKALVLGLNFYVFHEMAHIKFEKDLKDFSYIVDHFINIYPEMLKIIIESNDNQFNINFNINECLCDIYALIHLFDCMSQFIYKDNYHYILNDMIEIYMISIINIVLMDCIYINGDLEGTYVNAYYRIIIVLNVLGILYEENGKLGVLKEFQIIMKCVFEKYSNFKFKLINNMEQMSQLFDNEEEIELFSEEWYKYNDEIINIISSIK